MSNINAQSIINELHTPAVSSADTSHLVALTSRMDNERAHLENARSNSERESRTVIVEMRRYFLLEWPELRKPQDARDAGINQHISSTEGTRKSITPTPSAGSTMGATDGIFVTNQGVRS